MAICALPVSAWPSPLRQPRIEVMSKQILSLRPLALALASTVLLANAATAAALDAEDGTSVASAYTYQTLDYPGASGTILWGLDDFGNLAGQYNASGHPGHAMAYRHGRFESLDPGGLFGDRFSAAGGPNDFGTLFGGYTDAL